MAISSGANRPVSRRGTSWHDVQLDNQQYIDHALPGRIEHRGREVVKVMLPLVKELAKVEKKS
ncbi:hypothetical protein LNP05_26305 [Klebsiella pneumoniae subsp. pneumoniae]|nr:hypothetical protein [Klebsiella pneumoniae subsp. pneumoniae]